MPVFYPDSFFFIDEFVFFKGTTPYTANFTPPAGPWTVDGTIQSNPIIIAPPDPVPVPIVPPLDISTGPFCLEIDFKLNNLFEWTVGGSATSVQYYGIVAQFDQEEDGSIEEGGNYWSLYFRVNEDYTTDIIFEVFKNGAIATQLIHPVTINWSDWDGIAKTYQDAGYIHIAVSRSGDEARLYVDGKYTDYAGASGELLDFDTINGDWQINGPSGQDYTGQLNSVTSVNDFRVFDYAYYWADYTYYMWSQGTGIKIYPRVGIRMVEGIPGTIRARLAI